MKKLLLILFLLVNSSLILQAQKYLYLYQNDGQIQKISLTKVDSITFPITSGVQSLNLYRSDGNTNRRALTGVDSLVISDTKLFKGNYLLEKYTVPTMNIEVADGAAITSKEDYLACSVTIDGKGDFSDYSGSARIRGRGNSSWSYYPKKPYRIKLDNKAEILGLGSDKDWVLLSNYRDPTMLMNAFGFEMADWMGLHYTNHSRYIEVTLNGEYLGLYQLTEQVEQGGDRVDINDNTGVLIYVDLDDGPSLSPDATNNFWSTVYQVPVCVKYPQDPSTEQVSAIQADFAQMENYIKQHNYDSLATRLDISSFIDYLMIEELVHNVEMSAPRSIYMYKDSDNIYHMGPVWDFDGAFSYSWTSNGVDNWLASHNYFTSQGTIYGDQPASSNNVNRFFTGMFNNARFVKEYKARWAALKDSIMPHVWGVMENILDGSTQAYVRNLNRWSITPDYTTEVDALKDYLTKRIAKLTTVIANYNEPDGDDVLKPQDSRYNNVTQTFDVSFPASTSDYTGITVSADMQSLCNAFQLKSDSILSSVGSVLTFYGVNSDGSYTTRTTANGYGHWFNGSGDVCSWGDNSVVYSEFSETGFTFTLGQFPGGMDDSLTYTIKQALVYNQGNESDTALFVFNIKAGDEKSTRTITEQQKNNSNPGGQKDTTIVVNKTLTFAASLGYSGPDLEVDMSDYYSYFGYSTLDDFIAAINSQEVSYIAIDGSTGKEVTKSSANRRGYWFDAQGDVCNWGSAARVFMEPTESTFTNPLTFGTGVYPGQAKAGDVFTVTEAFKKDLTTLKIVVKITLTE